MKTERQVRSDSKWSSMFKENKRTQNGICILH